MSEIHFDVNLISKINFRASYCSDMYKWRGEELIPKYKKVLLFFKVGDGFEVKPAGFYEERGGYYSDKIFYLHATEEYLKQYGYLIKEFGNHDGISYRKEVWCRASVEVSLGYKSGIGKSFDTDQEAKDWIDKLKEMSGKTFEVITH